MLLLTVVVVLVVPGGRSWARSLQEDSLGREVKHVKKDLQTGESGQNTFQDVGSIVQVNSTGDFNAQVAQKSVLDDMARGVEKWLKEYIEDNEEGRHFKRKRMMLQMMMWLKTLGLGVVLPLAVAIALFTAWKGITISLLALMLAGIVGLKGLVSSATSKSTASHPQHVILSGVPSHHDHYWQRRSEPHEDSPSWSDSSSHRLVYRAYTS